MSGRQQSVSAHIHCDNMTSDLTPRKTMLILVIVVGCFAVLWPKVFYPMLVGSATQRIKPSPIDRTTGCCDLISETDVNTIKIMSELCHSIVKKDEGSILTDTEIVAKCHNTILVTCGIDISAVLQEQVRLGQTTKQILNAVRSLNGSLCLKYNFGVSPSRLGVLHTIKKSQVLNVRQERPAHVRSEMVHPAFRERGRAIPQTQASPSHQSQPKIIQGRPGPIPAMRPTLGGAGHVVPPPKQSAGPLGFIMPIYTIGIVIFFTYTVMKIIFKKQSEALYPPVNPDRNFKKEVFEAGRGRIGSGFNKDGVSNKLVVNAMSALLDEVDQELTSRQKATEVTEQDVMTNSNDIKEEPEQPSVKIIGMEMTACCEGDKKWSRPESPVLPTPNKQIPQQQEPLQEIYLAGTLPPQSHHLLVSDSGTQAEKMANEEDPTVVLAGKMTLSVISLDSSETSTEECSTSGKKDSNKPEDFEKINERNSNNGTEHIEDIGNKNEERTSSNFTKNFEIEDVGQPDPITDIIETEVNNLGQSILDDIKKEIDQIENENELISKLSLIEQNSNLENKNVSSSIQSNEFIVKEAGINEVQLGGNTFPAPQEKTYENVVLEEIRNIQQDLQKQKNEQQPEMTVQGNMESESENIRELNESENTEFVKEFDTNEDMQKEIIQKIEVENAWNLDSQALVDDRIKKTDSLKDVNDEQVREEEVEPEEEIEEIELEENEMKDDEIEFINRMEAEEGRGNVDILNEQIDNFEEETGGSEDDEEDDEDVEIQEIIEYVSDEEETEEEDVETEDRNSVNHVNEASNAD